MSENNQTFLNQDNALKVAHIITDVAMGGAEMMLYKLLSAMHREAFPAAVISLRGDGVIGERIRALGIGVRCLNMHPGIPNLPAWWRLVEWLRDFRPQVVQTWMYHADLLGGLAARFVGQRSVIWNIRNSTLDDTHTRRSTRLVVRMLALLSGSIPWRIVSCSAQAAAIHQAYGYRREKMQVIPNGFDVDLFFPRPDARSSVARELGLDDGGRWVGCFARFDPQKDHLNFIQAAALLQREIPKVHFLLCGDGINGQNRQLVGWIEEAGLGSAVHLLDRREDIPRLLSALDVLAVSSAYGEAFPNIVGEAMACEIPCVVTDLGDSREIVSDTGRVVPARNAKALAQGMLEILRLSSEAHARLGQSARQRIEHTYALPQVVEQYAQLYRSAVNPVPMDRKTDAH